MQQGQERIIISLNPEINPTGKKHPKIIKQEMVHDPDFLELSSDEQIALLKKVENLIRNFDSIQNYGSLKEKFETMKEMVENQLQKHNKNLSDYEYYLLLGRYNQKLNEFSIVNVLDNSIVSGDSLYEYVDGRILKEGETVLSVCAHAAYVGSGNTILELISQNELCGCDKLVTLWNIRMPFKGKVFALTKFDDSRKNITKDMQKFWDEDILIIGSVNDTRQEVIDWYKKTTGKTPSFKTKIELKFEKQASKERIKKVASKWGI